MCNIFLWSNNLKFYSVSSTFRNKLNIGLYFSARIFEKKHQNTHYKSFPAMYDTWAKNQRKWSKNKAILFGTISHLSNLARSDNQLYFWTCHFFHLIWCSGINLQNDPCEIPWTKNNKVILILVQCDWSTQKMG